MKKIQFAIETILIKLKKWGPHAKYYSYYYLK